MAFLNHLKEHARTFVKAMGMGTADLIPGVSGGTIAFITGIYERFINALSHIDHRAVKMLFNGQIKDIIIRVDLWFLLTILAGILTAVLTLSRIIDYLLTHQDIILWAFFFGLILSSIGVVFSRITKWRNQLILWLAAGTIISYFITQSQIIQTPHTPLYIFGAGFFSISAMILPGISGSYILVVLDKYNFFIEVMSSIGQSLQSAIGAFFSFQWAQIYHIILKSRLDDLLIFYGGTITGIITFSKILNWLITTYHDRTVSLLTGFMAGSLFKIWPWKVTIETFTDRHGEERPLVEENVLPAFDNPETWLAFLFMAIGFGLVILIHKLGRQKPTHKQWLD